MTASEPRAERKKGLIALLAGAVTIAFIVYLSAADLYLAAVGTSVQGTVTGKTRDEGNSSDSQTRYFLAYRFEHEGAAFEGSDEVTFGAYSDHEAGDAIEVRYAASDPAVNAVRGPRWFILIFALALGALFVRLGFRSMKQARDPGAT